MDYRGISNINDILITGITGVLGGRILQDLLENTEANIYCLMRGKDFVKARERIAVSLLNYDTEKKLANEIETRVIPILGDLSKNRLGIDKHKYEELIQKIKLVIHSGANTSLIASYRKLKPTNVDGTAKIVDFCLEADIPLLYVSSFSMLGDRIYEEGFVLMEDDFDIGQKFDNNHNYERTKFESERIVREASSRGLKWSIVRPGNIFGDSVTGCYPFFSTNVKGIYYDIMQTVIETGYSFDNPEVFDVTPVDYVAQAAVYIGLNIEEKTHGKTYHLVNHETLIFNNFVEIIRDYGYIVRQIDTDEYFSAIMSKKMKKNGKTYTSNFIAIMNAYPNVDAPNELACYDTRQAKELLEMTDIQCAKPDIKLIKVLIDYCIKCELFVSPNHQYPLAEIVK